MREVVLLHPRERAASRRSSTTAGSASDGGEVGAEERGRVGTDVEPERPVEGRGHERRWAVAAQPGELNGESGRRAETLAAGHCGADGSALETVEPQVGVRAARAAKSRRSGAAHRRRAPARRFRPVRAASPRAARVADALDRSTDARVSRYSPNRVTAWPAVAAMPASTARSASGSSQRPPSRAWLVVERSARCSGAMGRWTMRTGSSSVGVGAVASGKVAAGQPPPDEGLHLVRVETAGDVEGDPFVGAVLVGVRVPGVDGHLVLAADDQHGAAQHDERPEGGEIGVVERTLRREGGDRVQHRQRLGRHVMQRRGDGGGEFGDEPADGHVAEVDHAGGRIRRRSEHDVVVGDVAVHRLGAQPGTERGEPSGARRPSPRARPAAWRGWRRGAAGGRRPRRRCAHPIAWCGRARDVRGPRDRRPPARPAFRVC